jgi:hypothetical protein
MNLVRSIAAFLLIPFAGFFHYLLAIKFSIYENRPLWFYLIIVACGIVLIRALIREKKKKIFLYLINVSALFLIVGIIWWIEFLSSYKTFNFPYKIKDSLNQHDTFLVNDKGAHVKTTTIFENHSYTLLHFFRGHW